MLEEDLLGVQERIWCDDNVYYFRSNISSYADAYAVISTSAPTSSPNMALAPSVADVDQ